MAVEIRLAQPYEFPAIADLWIEMCKEELPESTPDKELWVSFQTKLSLTGAHSMAVAMIDGRYIGFADGLVYVEPSLGCKVAQGQYIYVSPEYRFSSIAPRLYALIQKVGKSQGAKKLYITCLLNNKKMWERKGFKVERYVISKNLKEVV